MTSLCESKPSWIVSVRNVPSNAAVQATAQRTRFIAILRLNPLILVVILSGKLERLPGLLRWFDRPCPLLDKP